MWLKNIDSPDKVSERERRESSLLTATKVIILTNFWLECCSNNIHTTFLIHHCSHVLHPLGVAVFCPVKNSYRKELNKLNVIVNSMKLDKYWRILCYYKLSKAIISLKTWYQTVKLLYYGQYRWQSPLRTSYWSN